MGAVRLLVGSELRRRWRSLAVTALLVGLTGAVTLAAVGGARRTSSSFDRFLESTRSHDVLVFARTSPGRMSSGSDRSPALLPSGMHVSSRWSDRTATSSPSAGPSTTRCSMMSTGCACVEGRAPVANAPEEVVLGEPLARSSGLGPGRQPATPELHPAPGRSSGSGCQRAARPRWTRSVVLRVVGVSRSPIDLSLQGADGGLLLLSRAGSSRRTAPGSATSRGRRAACSSFDSPTVRQVCPDSSTTYGPCSGIGRSMSIPGPQHRRDPGLSRPAGRRRPGLRHHRGARGLFALALIIGRQAALLGADQATVRDLGLPRSTRTFAIAGPLLLAVAVGELAAVLGAWAASPLMPFGVAGARARSRSALRRLGAGRRGFALAAFLGGIVGAAAWRAARAGRSGGQAHRRQSALARALEAAGLAPVATIGVGLALEPGHGRTVAPVRSPLVGAALAVLGVTAVVVFASSLGHLVETPHAYGINWDARVTDSQGRPELEGHRCGRTETRLSNNPTSARSRTSAR